MDSSACSTRQSSSSIASSDDALDLSRFAPNPDTKAVTYKYACDDRKMIVYARKSDSIVPFDRFSIEFDGGRMLVEYPRDGARAPEMIERFAKCSKSFGMLMRIMTCMVCGECYDAWMLDVFYYRACEMVERMERARIDYHRGRFIAVAHYWPTHYFNMMMHCFSKAYYRAI